MHFSKAYTQLLVSLPPELRNHPFEYRKLKQLINQAASELDSLGLGPSVLQSLPESRNSGDSIIEEEDGTSSTLSIESKSASSEGSDESCRHTVIYEIALDAPVPEPRLRLSSSRYLSDVEDDHSTAQSVYHVDVPISEQSFGDVTRAILHHPPDKACLLDDSACLPEDLIIPLPSDAAFFQLLTSTLSSISNHLDNLQEGFNANLSTLAASISLTARPVSSSAPKSFLPYSVTSNDSISLLPRLGGKSDLCTWREIFRLYAEAEIFESVKESTLGEKEIEAVEEHLKLFEGRIQGQKASLVLSKSREALDAFINLNVFILNLRKFQLANSEATRKILKKHLKHTTLLIPPYLLDRYASSSASPSSQVALISRPSKSTSLPRRLVQAIGEILLPVVPHIDDYSCPICTAIAFKPVRLSCGHFFCLRCLVKMQRRGMAKCAMCRAPTVLQATRSNVDYALLNFIADWFPIESREKQCANEQEVIQEQLHNLGIADARGCQIM